MPNVGKRQLPIAQKRVLSSDTLFAELFLPLYPPGADVALLRETDANPAKNPAFDAQLEQIGSVFARLAPRVLGTDPELDGSDASIHRLSPLLTADVRDAALERSEGGVPLLALLAIHGAAYVAGCVVRNHQGRWLVRSPLWESRVRLASAAGIADLAPFSWWLKALGDDEIGKGTLADRYRTLVEVPTFDAESLAVIAPHDRRLPRLGSSLVVASEGETRHVRYDMLHKYLKAHLPELRSVGDDFPSPERFDELALRSLEFLLVGGGRMLVAFGPSKTGLHLFFLTKEGFSKGAYLDAAPPFSFEVSSRGDKLHVTVTKVGGAEGDGASEPSVFECMWWGP